MEFERKQRLVKAALNDSPITVQTVVEEYGLNPSSFKEDALREIVECWADDWVGSHINKNLGESSRFFSFRFNLSQFNNS